jgi:predicted methyltransferase
MLTKSQIFATVAAIVTTLDEVESDAAESTISMAMEARGMNLSTYYAIRNLMVASGLVTVKGNRIALTEKGRELAKECDKATAAK